MKTLDYVLQNWRIDKVRPYIKAGDRVLDIGCADRGELFRRIPGIVEGIGIDPDLHETRQFGNYRLIKGFFPQDVPDGKPFDAITILAVLEHILPAQQTPLAQNCARFLKQGGHLLLTVPSPAVDRILAIFTALRLVDGMELKQHYGFDASSTPSLFTPAGFELVKSSRFQLGMNNLFVFIRK